MPILRGAASAWGSRIRIQMPRPGSLSRDVFEPVLSAASDAEEIRRMLPFDSGTLPEEDDEADLRDEIVAPKRGTLRLT